MRARTTAIRAREASQVINRSYNELLERVRAELAFQTALSDMYGAIGLTLDGEVLTPDDDLSDVDLDDLGLDFSGVPEVEGAAARRGEFLRSLAALLPPTPEILSAIALVSAEWSHEFRYHSLYLKESVSNGGIRDADLYLGNSDPNTFRTTDGGNDRLVGLGGSDIYQLGPGTGHDVIDEDRHGGNGGSDVTDVVMVAPGVARSSVLLQREGHDLVVSILDSEGSPTDSLRVLGQYVNPDAAIERVELGDGTVYGAEDLAALPLSGGVGTSGPDSYDALGSTDPQRGGAGSDVYMLGRDTGHSSIEESHQNHLGSTGDAIRLKSGLSLADVKLSRVGADLVVGLTGAGGAVSDSLAVKGHFLGGPHRVERLESSDGALLLDLVAAQGGVALLNGSGGGVIEGLGNGIADTFGSDAGSDTYRGRSGDDVYVLARGSGTDYVEEGHGNLVAGDAADTIRIGAGIASSMVRMRRTMWDLVVELVDGNNEVTDSLTVRDQYRHGRSAVERVILNDGTSLWTTRDFDALAFAGPAYASSSNVVRGTASRDSLRGSNAVNDVFDADAGGDDTLYGQAGDDEYRLGSGTGADTIYEGTYNTAGGDAGDLIRVEAGHGVADVRLRRDDRHLWVELLGAADGDGARAVSDSLKVHDYFHSANAKVESVVFSDGTVWDSDDFHAVALRGGTGNDYVHGRSDLADIFDADAGGDDTLYGKAGDDEYRLGSGTGADTIYEGTYNSVPGNCVVCALVYRVGARARPKAILVVARLPVQRVIAACVRIKDVRQVGAAVNVIVARTAAQRHRMEIIRIPHGPVREHHRLDLGVRAVKIVVNLQAVGHRPGAIAVRRAQQLHPQVPVVAAQAHVHNAMASLNPYEVASVPGNCVVCALVYRVGARARPKAILVIARLPYSVSSPPASASKMSARSERP